MDAPLFELLEFDTEDGRHAGQIRAKLGKQGRSIEPYDLLIAGRPKPKTGKIHVWFSNDLQIPSTRSFLASSAMPLDLHLAWRRVRLDHRKERGFVVHPSEVLLIEHDLAGWLDELNSEVSSGTYRPDSAYVVDVPKGSGAVRPGSVLSLRDQVVFAAMIDQMVQRILPVFEWTKDAPDHSYRIRAAAAPDWLERRFVGWSRFHDRSLQLLKESNYCVITDVSGFYENIQHRILISDLQAVGVDPSLTQLLALCLARWSTVRGRGIPQGYTPADLLAKLYLTRIDQAMREAEFTHIRYSDDIRIFCESRSEARKALLELQRLMRQRGLNLQSKKTSLLRADEAQPLIDGVVPVILSLVGRHRREVAEAVGLDPAYSSPEELREAFETSGLAPPTTIVRAAYEAYFGSQGDEFKKSLFRYLLNRLGEAGDDYAVASAVSYLDEHPEETDAILAYIERVQSVAQSDSMIVKYLTSSEAVYPFQHYQIIRWRGLSSDVPDIEFVAYVRRVERAARTPAYLRSAARMFLGRFGSAADLDNLESAYSSASSDLERAEIVCATYRLERSRRNGFYSECRRDSQLIETAVELALNNAPLWEGLPPGHGV